MTVPLIKTPDGFAELIATFGDIREYIQVDGTLSPKWEEEHIERIQLPEAVKYAFDPRVVITKVTVHKLIADIVAEMHDNIHKRGLWHLLGPYGGGFNFRSNRNAGAKLSTHSWAIAFDWDPLGFPNGSTRRRPVELTTIVKSYGFVMGQDFHETKDPMHWQFCKNY